MLQEPLPPKPYLPTGVPDYGSRKLHVLRVWRVLGEVNAKPEQPWSDPQNGMLTRYI